MIRPKHILVIVLVTGIIFLAGCEKKSIVSPSKSDQFSSDAQSKNNGSFKIGVFSDAHYYDANLGTDGEAYDMYVAQDPKMLKESDALLQATVNKLINEDVDIVLVPGDLTKDGELHNHQKVAAYLSQLEDAGKKVYVIPGNHDILNPNASYFSGSALVPMANTSREEFTTIYNDFGYGEAIHDDQNSLSYIACPKDGIWIVALDGCNYGNRFPGLSAVDGKLSNETLSWIIPLLQGAKDDGISVIGFMHHGIVEHFPGMEQVFPEYLVDDWMNVADLFASNGLNVVFTGHHHATDIAVQGSGAESLFDIQTGSLVTWQCPYRIVRFNRKAGVLHLDNKIITHITPGPGMDFQTYAYGFLASRLPMLVVYQLMQMGMDQPTATYLEPLVSATLLAYYHGDESTMQDPQVLAGIYQLLENPNPAAQNLGQLLLGIWFDNTPDSDVLINTRNGIITVKDII
jgi:hypothetical protein